MIDSRTDRIEHVTRIAVPLVLGALILAGCQTDATTETKPTVTQTPSTERSVEYALADEKRAAITHADPFTGTCKGSWFGDERGDVKRWQQPAKVRFLSSTPDSVSIAYYQSRGWGASQNADSIKVIRNDLPRKGNSFSRPVSKGDTVVFTAEEGGSIKMERRTQSGRVKWTGRLWCKPEQSPDVPAELAALEGTWSGRARSDRYGGYRFNATVEIDVFPEGPHIVVAAKIHRSNIRFPDGSMPAGNTIARIEHVLPENFSRMSLIRIRSDDSLSMRYRVGRGHPHTVLIDLTRKGGALTN